jgi:hypothetical protein
MTLVSALGASLTKDVLMHHLDLQNMVELAKFVRRLGKTSPLGDIIGATPTPAAHTGVS